MDSRYIIGLVAIVALAGYFLFFRGEAPIRNYPSQGSDIVAYGDSLVLGVGATKGNDFVSLLSKKIKRPIINLGNSGDTTADGLARLNELDTYNSKVVILLLGGNDYLRHVSSEQTFQNLAKVIEHIQSRGAIVLLLGVRGGLFGDHFDSKFEKLHDTYHTGYVSNVLSGLLGNDAYMSDQIHPNDAGYARIAERVYPVLKKLVE